MRHDKAAMVIELARLFLKRGFFRSMSSGSASLAITRSTLPSERSVLISIAILPACCNLCVSALTRVAR